MKGSLFVGVYSVFLIGLFILCCYLMSTVNPKPLPEALRRLDNDEDIYTVRPFPKKYQIDYGLEKIPDDVDADEYRRSTVTYHNGVGRERGHKVSPPIWPQGASRGFEEDNKISNKSIPKDFYDSTSPAKGLRRSVGDNKHDIGIVNPGSILLKVIDDSGRKKIEIKIISKDKIKETKMRPNRSFDELKSNQSFDVFSNQNNFNVTNGSEDSIIKIKGNDVIVLTIAADIDRLMDKDGTSESENVKYKRKMANNTSNTYIYSKFNTTTNDTNSGNLQEAEKQLKKNFMNNEMYNVNLLSNSDTTSDKN